jgi:hypothetical protein
MNFVVGIPAYCQAGIQTADFCLLRFRNPVFMKKARQQPGQNHMGYDAFC